MKKEHKKFLKILKKSFKTRPDANINQILNTILPIESASDKTICAWAKISFNKNLKNDAKKEKDTCTEGSSTGGSGKSSSEKES